MVRQAASAKDSHPATRPSDHGDVMPATLDRDTFAVAIRRVHRLRWNPGDPTEGSDYHRTAPDHATRGRPPNQD